VPAKASVYRIATQRHGTDNEFDATQKKEDIHLHQRQMSSQYCKNKNQTAGVGNEATASGAKLPLSCLSSSERQSSWANGRGSSSNLRLDPSPQIERMDC
jgi:hypothetical protein